MPALAAPAATTPVTNRPPAVLPPLAEVILIRASLPAGATRAELLRDLRPTMHAELAPAAWRHAADHAVALLVELGFALESRGRLKPTP